MGVGHLAVGLILKKADRRINLGYLFFAAFLSDFLLGVFYWLGFEHAFIPPNYQQLHYLTFDFPYSHGLVASLLWSALAFLLAKYLWSQGNSTRVAILLAVAVFSHFILDVIVHVPELPLLGRNSVKLGLGLWNQMGFALTLEMLLVVVALILYLGGREAKSFRGKYGVLILILVFSLLTIMGMTSSAPPNITAATVSCLAVPIIAGGLAVWLDQKSEIS